MDIFIGLAGKPCSRGMINLTFFLSFLISNFYRSFQMFFFLNSHGVATPVIEFLNFKTPNDLVLI